MQSKKYPKLLIEILNMSNTVILKKEEVIGILGSKDDVEKLSKEQYIIEEKNIPTECPFDGCDSKDIDFKFKDDKILIRDLTNPSHEIEESINKWITCELNISKIIQELLLLFFNNIKCFNIIQIENMYRLQTIYNENEVDVVFSLSKHILEDELFKSLGSPLIFKRPVIIITKETDDNFGEINSMCLKMPIGNFVYPFYIKDFENKESGEDLKEWIDRILEIKKMEDEILGDLPTKRSELVYNIDINPKYLLSFLVRLKAYKSKKGQEKYDWKEMENAISVAFRYLYHSDIRYGGSVQSGKNVPDNIFFVKNRENNKFVVTGVVDTKFSKAVDLNAEKTEKYEEYLKLARSNPYAPEKIALVFPLLDVKTDTSIQKFFDRLKKKMKPGEFCLVMPIDTLEILVYLYLSAILRGKLDLTENDFIKIREQIFDTDFLEKTCKLDSNLYKLNFEIIKNLIKDIAGKESSVESITSRIMDKR